MGKVIIDMTMSIDGFVAGPEDGRKNGLGNRDGVHLHDWLFNGTSVNRHNPFFKTKAVSLPVVNRMIKDTGAMIFGRRTYDITNGWNGSHPIPNLLIFILTHHPPKKVPVGNTTFVFVGDGIKSAVTQAKKAAGKKDVLIQGASVCQQALQEGLVDELLLHIANRVMGKGVPLFESAGTYFGSLKRIECIAAPDVTHLRYKVG
ncbi:MAG TPA: dihydrofolate reductase family protein [Chitinophagaceae bacterium]|nr:dihydrofolate reductase family protein [Chitinophagaceae bacterium]